ncbi:MAG TPA: alcohol dehydrogenase catalytic domain-containing protein [Aggregatilineales bacterium]|nr:alcohol dehydrogenase catalytic domain-containing protein [Anaerolineales bacterium]HRE49428.1 alcohol dehydrogenase catalytic domain-containing protein [Aggregatilineales bacterium]
MDALRFDHALRVVGDEPLPTPAPDEALIRLRLAGICHTDLELTRGYMGFQGILGHEFVGELAAPAGDFPAGQRVVGEINVACERCPYCAAGMGSQCPHRVTMGIDRYPGAFAEVLRLPIRNLHAVPAAVPDEVAVFAEPLAAAFQALAMQPIRPADRVIVLGAGKLGLLTAQVVRLTGCDLSVLARQPRPLALLRQWGIPALDGNDQGWLAAYERHSAQVVIDCTGSAEGFALALDLCRPRGTILLKSTYAGVPSADLTRIVIDELRIVGSRCGDFPAALRAMAAGLIDVTSLIEARYPLREALRAFDHAAGRGVLKVLLTP